MIGDYDPEDAYDESDPPLTKLRVLEAVVAELYAGPPDDPRRELGRVDALRLVDRLQEHLTELRARAEAIRQALEDL